MEPVDKQKLQKYEDAVRLAYDKAIEASKISAGCFSDSDAKAAACTASEAYELAKATYEAAEAAAAEQDTNQARA